MDAKKVYDQVKAAWQEAGLLQSRVMDTPGWQVAVDRIAEYAAERGWHASPMGPIPRDIWINWLHILSHKLEDGHGFSHATCELELARLAIETLQNADQN